MKVTRRILAVILATSALSCATTAGSLSKMSFKEVGRQPTGVLLEACAENPRQPDPFVVENLRQRDDIRLLDARRCPSLLPEFVWRREIRKEFLPSIRKGEVVVGMNENEMKLARGEPIRSTEQGSRTEHVYGSYGPYVYTVNGVVVGFRN